MTDSTVSQLTRSESTTWRTAATAAARSAAAAAQSSETSLRWSIAATARELAQRQGFRYAKSQAPVSPFPELTGNRLPGVTAITWLRGRNKCNQFVGDVLYASGYGMPTFTMADGSKHFMNAEALPAQTAFFKPIGGFSNARPGDLVVFDRLNRRGENGAHVELITAIDPLTRRLRLTGARPEGASEKDFSNLFASAAQNPSAYQTSSERIIILRPVARR